MSIICIICYEAFVNDTDVVNLNRCGHIYHGKCLEEWKKSTPGSRTSCPVCRKTYDKRSMKKLYFNVEEPEEKRQLKRQKLISENLAENNKILAQEILEKVMKIHEMNQKRMKDSLELDKVKQDYKIKCEAYNLMDTINNQYIYNNMRLSIENEELKEELEKMRESIRCHKIVDLTCEKDESDDEIQMIEENSRKIDIIEIIDDDEKDDTCSDTKKELDDSSILLSEEKSAKRSFDSDDRKCFEQFNESQT